MRRARAVAAILAVLSIVVATGAGQTVRLSIKRVNAVYGGTTAFWTTEQILEWAEDVRFIFRTQAGLRLELVELQTVQDPPGGVNWFTPSVSDIGAMEAECEGNPSLSEWTSSAVNIYLVNQIVGAGGVCSFPMGPNSDLILVAPNILNGSVGLAHELGHYFNLRHTHASFEGAAGGCAGGSSGDCVSDTPNDVNPALCNPFTVECHNANLAALYGAGSSNYDTLRFNVMSYHGLMGPGSATLTDGQAARIAAALPSRSYVIDDSPVPVRKYFFGDFNGDGYTDQIRYLQGVGELVYLWDPSSQKHEYNGVWSGAGLGEGSEGFYVGDFDGDGRDDFCRQRTPSGSTTRTEVFLSSGTDFQPHATWTTATFGAGQQGWYVGDFTGDGKSDLMRWVSGSGCEVFESTGSSFVNLGSWSTAGNGLGLGFYVGDFNGDGRADLARHKSPSTDVFETRVYLSTGASFESQGSWIGESFGQGPSGWYVGDFNGDGLDDLFRYLPGVSGADVKLSTGWSFIPDGSWTAEGTGYQPKGWHVGDFNGDGYADLYRDLATASPRYYFSRGDAFQSALPAPSSLVLPFRLTATVASGSGVTLALTGLPPGVLIGATLASADVSGLLAQGSVFGIEPDTLTTALVATPAAPGNPWMFLPPFSPGAYPTGSVFVPTGPVPPGLAVDLVVVAIASGASGFSTSTVTRVAF